MYVIGIVFLMLVCPAVAVALEARSAHHAAILLLVGKWYVFWAVGIRLFTAGLRQVSQPQFTAEKIFGIQERASFAIVREVGFGNLAMGTLGICSLYRAAWIIPAAVAGGLYYGLAALMHLFRKGENATEQMTTASDAFAFAVLLFFVVKSLT